MTKIAIFWWYQADIWKKTIVIFETTSNFLKLKISSKTKNN